MDYFLIFCLIIGTAIAFGQIASLKKQIANLESWVGYLARNDARGAAASEAATPAAQTPVESQPQQPQWQQPQPQWQQPQPQWQQPQPEEPQWQQPQPAWQQPQPAWQQPQPAWQQQQPEVEQPQPAAVAETAVAAAASDVPVAAQLSREEAVAPAAAAVPAGAGVPQAAVWQPAAPSAPKAPTLPAIDWEFFAGGRLLNIAGAIVLIIGVALFMKYAFDNNWIGAPLRVLAGLVAGGAAIGGGAFMHRKQKESGGPAWFAEGIFGTGLGILYISGYAAFSSFHLIPFAAAFAFMAAVTALAFVLALRYDSVAMAAIGWAGGFVTPFAVGVGLSNEAGIGSYLVLLDAGICAIAYHRRKWFAFSPFALLASYLVVAVWYVSHVSAPPALSAIFATSLWAVFFAAGVAETVRDGGKDENGGGTLTGILNAMAYWGSTCYVLWDFHTAFAATQAVAAVAYAGAYALALKRFATSSYRALYGVLGFSFAAGAVFAGFSGGGRVLAFIVLGVAFAVLSSLARKRAGAPQRAALEAAMTAGGFWLAGVLSVAFVPDAFDNLGAWKLSVFGRDFVLLAAVAAGFAIDRLTRGTVAPAAGGVLRAGSLLLLAGLDAFHYAEYKLALAFGITGLLVAVIDRGLRLAGKSYASLAETATVTLVWQVFAFGFFALAANAFERRVGGFDLHAGSRDFALLALLVAASISAYLLRSEAGTKWPFATIFRIGALVEFSALLGLHTTTFGFATSLALRAVAIAAGDRLLRRAGLQYASAAETAYTALSLVGLGGLVALVDPLGFAYRGTTFAFGFGGADSTLAALAIAALLVAHFGKANLHPAVQILARQSAAIALVVSAFVHEEGLGLGATIAVIGAAFAEGGARALLLDLQVDGLVLAGGALLDVLVSPESWQAPNLATFVPFHDARAGAFALIALACFVAGDAYRRHSLLPPWVGRALRLCAIGVVIFGFTGELRDGFEHAILGGGPLALEHLRNSEGLAVSGLWIVSSVVMIAAGVWLRIKEFRVAAIVLFDVTTLKAFFVDLSQLATPYRILSFVGLGLTLLAVSYVYQRIEGGGRKKQSTVNGPDGPAGPASGEPAAAAG